MTLHIDRAAPDVLDEAARIIAELPEAYAEEHQIRHHLADELGGLACILRDWMNPTPVETIRPLESLQRELLALCRGGKSAEAWCMFSGTKSYEWDGKSRRRSRIASLRFLIQKHYPGAALYLGWERT